MQQNSSNIHTTFPTETRTPRHGFKSSQGGMQSAGLRLLSEPLAWRSARLWQISPHSTEARRMVLVSTAQSLPSLSPHRVCVRVWVCVHRVMRQAVLGNGKIQFSNDKRKAELDLYAYWMNCMCMSVVMTSTKKIKYTPVQPLMFASSCHTLLCILTLNCISTKIEESTNLSQA